MAVNEVTEKSDELGHFLQNVVEITVKVSEKLASNVVENLGKEVEKGIKTGSAALSKNHKAALPTFPDGIKFYHIGNCLNLVQFV